jgi:hypothetical protein
MDLALRGIERELHEHFRSASPVYRGSPHAARSLLDLRLDQHGEVGERLLPAEIAGLKRDRGRQTFMDDVDLGADRPLLAGKVRVLEAVRVADVLAWHKVFATEGMDFAGGEVGE